MATTIVTRTSKGGRLSITEMDANFTNLKTTADAAAPQATTYTKSEIDNKSVTINAGTGLSGGGSVAFGSNVTITNAGVTNISGTSGQISTSGSTGNVVLSLPNTVTMPGDLTVTGNLSVSGTTTTINATTVSVSDINIELGKTASPTDATAANGGITLKGTTDKTITWGSTNGWTSSESLNLAAGKTYKINGVDVLSNTTLGSGVISSSLTSVGTITSGTWSGSFGSVSGANLTSLTAGNLTGTIPSTVLGNSTHYIGTTAVTLNRASANLGLTGISSIALPGSTSGTVTIQPTATAGTTTITLPAANGTVITTGDSGTVTSAMIADGTIVNADISASAAIATSKINGLAASATTDATNANNITSGTLSNARLSSIPNSALANSSVTVTAGTGLSGGGSVALGSSIALNANSASTSIPGIVQLTDSISSTSITTAATPNSVKTAYDLAATKLNSSGGTVSGDLTISGNVIVNGTTTTINATTLQVADNIVELRSGNNIVAADGGIQINLTTAANGAVQTSRTIKWSNASNRFQLTNDGTNYSNVAVTTDKLSSFASTTSSELAGVITDETGSGNLVFSTSPILTTPNIGAATATSLNKVTITAPATTATLTLANGSSLITSGAYSTTLTSTGTTNVTLPTSGTLATTDTTQTISGVKTFSKGIIPGATTYPIYEANVDWGNNPAGTWLKILDASLYDQLYSTVGFIVDIIDPTANHAFESTSNTIVKETYHIAMVRSGQDLTANTPDACFVSGPSNRIRAIKTAVGNYEIQIQNLTLYRECKIKISTYASNGTHVVNYHAGAVAGTALAIYTASVGGSVDVFQNISIAKDLAVSGNLTVSGTTTANLNASNITSGTIPSTVLGNSTHYVGTTAVALNRTSANLGLTGISSIALPGATSGTVTIRPTAAAGNTTITLPAANGTVITSGDTGTVTSTMIADGTIVNADISASAAISTSKITGLASSATTDTTNANNITSGIINTARLGSGTANSSTYLAGNNTWQTITGGATITDDVATNASYYPLLATATSGTLSASKTSSTKLYYNPSTGTMSATSFNSLSDERLKENIVSLFDINNSLEMIDSLNPVQFTWKDTGNISYGFIAQEVEEIIPEAIENGEYKSVNYSMIIPFLVEAVRELSQELKEVRERLEILETK